MFAAQNTLAGASRVSPRKALSEMTSKKIADEVVHVTVPIPRSALQIHEQAELASQVNAERLFGIKRRAYLETLPGYEQAGGKVARLGKLRLVRVADFVAFLFALGAGERRAPSSVSSVESELGLVEVSR